MDNEDKKAAVNHEYATRTAMINNLRIKMRPVITTAMIVILTYIFSWLKLEVFGLSTIFEKLVFVISAILSLGVITLLIPLLPALVFYERLASR